MLEAPLESSSTAVYASYRAQPLEYHRQTTLYEIIEDDETHQNNIAEDTGLKNEDDSGTESSQTVLTPEAHSSEDENAKPSNFEQDVTNENLLSIRKDFEDFCEAIVQGNMKTIKAFKNLDMLVGRVRNDGETPLTIAILENQYEIAKLLLENGADVHQQARMRPPIVYAALAFAPTPRFIQLLLDYGANPNTTSGPSRFNTLHWAAAHGRVDAVNFLIEKGMDTEKTCSIGRTALLVAAENGHTLVVKVLLAKGAELYHRSIKGGTALGWAATRNHEDTVEFLLKEGIDVNDRDYGGYSALYIASDLGFIETVELLVQKGADLNSEVTGWKGFTPIMTAAVAGHADVVQLLIEHGADLKVRDDQGTTLLEAALAEGHSDTVGILLEALGGHDYPQETKAFEIALAKCSEDIERILPDDLDAIKGILKEGGELVKPRAITNMMLVALLNEKLDMVEELLSNGCNPDIHLAGQTPLSLAVERHNILLVKLLLDWGADPNIESRNPDGPDYTPLHQALIALDDDIHRDTSVIDALLHTGRCKLMKGARRSDTAFHYVLGQYDKWDHGVGEILTFRMLEFNRGKHDDTSDDGSTLMHAAVWHERKDLIAVLLNRGFEIDVTNNMDRTPFLIECEVDTSMLSYLVERGANPHRKDSASWSAVHFAALSGQLDNIKFLIKLGIDVNAPDDTGRTPLLLAVENGHEDAALHLLEHGAYINNQKLERDETILHMAAGWGMAKLVPKILEHPDLDINAIIETEWAPLALACVKGSPPLITSLLDAGAAIEMPGKNSERPLHLALKHENEAVAEVLIQRGADITARGIQDCTPLHLAVAYGLAQSTRTLIERGADGSAVDDLGETPLCACPNAAIAKLLIDHGADVNHRDMRGGSPLHCAVEYKHIETFKVLLDAGADLGARMLDDGLDVNDRIHRLNYDETKGGVSGSHWAVLFGSYAWRNVTWDGRRTTRR